MSLITDKNLSPVNFPGSRRIESSAGSYEFLSDTGPFWFSDRKIQVSILSAGLAAVF